MYQRWTVSARDTEAEFLLCRELGLDPVTARVAASRGLTTPELFYSFLSDDDINFNPQELTGIKEAAETIRKAIDDGKKILIFGDYDCDGVTSTALMYEALTEMGARVSYMIPDRNEDGYGLSEKFVKEAVTEGIELIVTVDNGISCYDEVELAKTFGIDTVITDHHKPQGEIPCALAVVDPHIFEKDEKFSCLAGVGVAFVLVCELFGLAPAEVLWKYGDLIASGTVSDMMPLTGINRAIVKIGLDVMNEGTRAGISAVFEIAGQGDKKISTGAVSFGLAPRINAAGRIGSAYTALELLITDDENKARNLASKINEMNIRRQQIEQEIENSAIEIVEKNGYKYDRIIVVSNFGWNTGVVGIAASKLAEKYGKPAIVLSEQGEVSFGSGRGIQGFSLFGALNEVSDILVKFGGHELAAGVTVKTADIAEFRKRINECGEAENMPFMTVKTDCEASPEELSLETVYALSEFEPFGIGNPTPVILMRSVKLEGITPLSNGNHQKLSLSKNGCHFKALLFGKKNHELSVFVGDDIDIAVNLNINEFRDTESLSIVIKNLRKASSGGKECELAVRRYEDFKSERITGENALKILPEREDFAAVYKFINSVGICNSEAVLSSLGKQIGYDKCSVCIDTFTETGLIKSELKEGTPLLSKNNVNSKTDLSLSPTVKKINKIIKEV